MISAALPMLDFYLDRNQRGAWEYELFLAIARHLDSAVAPTRLRSAKTFLVRGPFWRRHREVELHHNLAVIQHRWTRQYWVLDGNDWVTPFNDNIRDFTRDRRCRAVLKCQYKREPYAHGVLRKVRAWTYFETHPISFQPWLAELRAAPRPASGLFFRGNVSWAQREPILAGLAERKIVNPDYARWVPYEQHARELAAHRAVLALEGMGSLCHREMEAFGAGTAVVTPRLKNELHAPLIPDHHYVSVAADVYDDPPQEVAARIEERYRQAAAEPGYLDFVAANAMRWYDANVRMPQSLDLTVELLGLRG